MSGIEMLLTSIADAEAISRLLAPGVTMIWLLDVSVTLVMGGGISFGAPIQFNKLENNNNPDNSFTVLYQKKLALR